MELNFTSLFTLTHYSISHPREAVRMLLAMQVPMAARWTGLVVVGVLSALMFHLSFMMQPADVQEVFSRFVMTPLFTAAVQTVFVLVSAVAVYRVGRMQGGIGSFEDGLLLVVWVQAVSVFIQIVQLLLMPVLPPAAEVLGLFGVGVYFWLMTHFIAELHGFKSLGLVFLSIILTMIAFGLALIFALALIIGPFIKV